MIGALIFVISLAALAQFTIYSWRASLIARASAGLSADVERAAGMFANSLTRQDFDRLVDLQKICPELSAAKDEVRLVKTYFRSLNLLKQLCAGALPSWSDWSAREMTTCTRYMAVVLDSRLQRNRDCITELAAL